MIAPLSSSAVSKPNHRHSVITSKIGQFLNWITSCEIQVGLQKFMAIWQEESPEISEARNNAIELLYKLHPMAQSASDPKPKASDRHRPKTHLSSSLRRGIQHLPLGTETGLVKSYVSSYAQPSFSILNLRTRLRLQHSCRLCLNKSPRIGHSANNNAFQENTISTGKDSGIDTTADFLYHRCSVQEFHWVTPQNTICIGQLFTKYQRLSNQLSLLSLPFGHWHICHYLLIIPLTQGLRSYPW